MAFGPTMELNPLVGPDVFSLINQRGENSCL